MRIFLLPSLGLFFAGLLFAGANSVQAQTTSAARQKQIAEMLKLKEETCPRIEATIAGLLGSVDGKDLIKANYHLNRAGMWADLHARIGCSPLTLNTLYNRYGFMGTP